MAQTPNESQAGGESLSLRVWQEAIGVLADVDRVNGTIIFRSFQIIVPPRELDSLRDLETFTGCRVGLLRTDLPTRPLLLRLAEEPGAEEVNG